MTQVAVALGIVVVASALAGCGGGGGTTESVRVTVVADAPDPVTVEVTTPGAFELEQTDEQVEWCASSDGSDRLRIASKQFTDAAISGDLAQPDVGLMGAALDDLLAAAEQAPSGTYCVVDELNAAAQFASSYALEGLVDRVRTWQDEHDSRTAHG